MDWAAYFDGADDYYTPRVVPAKLAAPARISGRSGSPLAVAQDVLHAAANKRGRASFAEWRKANPENGVILDHSKLSAVPDVAQHDLPRYEPPRGPSARIVDALADPAVASGINATVERGMAGGGLDWYNTEPVLERLRAGSNDAANAYKRLMDVVAATSPRSKVTDNIRTGSYYNYLLSNSLPIPEKPAAGYGSVAQNLHRDNVRGILERGGWDVFQNPKPASFSANLQGNQMPATIDTHNFRLPGILSGDPRFLETTVSEQADDVASGLETLRRQYPMLPDDVVAAAVGDAGVKGARINYRPREWVDKGYISPDDAVSDPGLWSTKPKDNEYGYYERWQQDQAKKYGISPAQYQASMWLGGGDTTGLGSAAEPFISTLEARVRYTADILGMDPDKLMDLYIHGKVPLLAEGGSVDVDELSKRYGC